MKTGDQIHAPAVLLLGKKTPHNDYVWGLIRFWLFLLPIFLFAAQPKVFLLDGLKKLQQRSHKCVDLRGEYVE
jgi:hypothetical protein